MEDRFYELLDGAPDNCKHVAELWRLSSNYDYEASPLRAFLILIGHEVVDGDVLNVGVLDYLGLSFIADALNEFSHRPESVNDFIVALLDAEHGEDF